MKKELKNCPECQFENGKHSFNCSHYKPMKNPVEKEIKERIKCKYKGCKNEVWRGICNGYCEKHHYKFCMGKEKDWEKPPKQLKENWEKEKIEKIVKEYAELKMKLAELDLNVAPDTPWLLYKLEKFAKELKQKWVEEIEESSDLLSWQKEAIKRELK